MRSCSGLTVCFVCHGPLAPSPRKHYTLRAPALRSCKCDSAIGRDALTWINVIMRHVQSCFVINIGLRTVCAQARPMSTQVNAVQYNVVNRQLWSRVMEAAVRGNAIVVTERPSLLIMARTGTSHDEGTVTQASKRTAHTRPHRLRRLGASTSSASRVSP
jgi:hypothetical protein